MKSKLIHTVVTNCRECPYSNFVDVSTSETLWFCELKQDAFDRWIYMPIENIDVERDIPDWCPLEDVENPYENI
jgi:hypothetical protein